MSPVGNEASFLPHRSELTDIEDIEEEDMSLDSAEVEMI